MSKKNLPNLNIFDDKQQLVRAFVKDFGWMCRKTIAEHGETHIALSGGNTPQAIFKALAVEFAAAEFWGKTHLWWGDERLVPHDDPESNYGIARTLLIDSISIPDQNVHPVQIFPDHLKSVQAYSAEILRYVKRRSRSNWPEFDWNLMGIGTDGHTASLFPASPALQDAKSICVFAQHPDSGQPRVSFSLPLINHSKRISFVICGSGKAAIVKRLLEDDSASKHLPAAMVKPVAGELDWYTDRLALAHLTGGTQG